MFLMRSTCKHLTNINLSIYLKTIVLLKILAIIHIFKTFICAFFELVQCHDLEDIKKRKYENWIYVYTVKV